jgi:gliding motility-associated-like protein
MPPVTVATGLADLFFVDNTVSGSGAEVCYVVRARFRPAAAAAAEVFVFSSNQACVTPVPELFMPNAFSPNGDGVNDVFRPFFSSPPPPEGYLLQVWDRWGGLIHETQDLLSGWDGTDGLQPVPNGTYLFILTYNASAGDNRRRAGTVNLLR